MRLTLGDKTYDLATRCLVLGVLGPGAGLEQAKGLVAEGADLVEVDGAAPADIAALVAGAGAPAGVAVTGDAAAALASGAVLVVDAPDAAAGTGAAVVVTAGGGGGDHGHDDLAAVREVVVRRARAAEAAGVSPERIVVDPDLALSPPRLGQARRFAELGYPLLVTHTDPAAIALAVTGGCRLVRTGDVRAARRVCDVLAAILEARP